MKIHFENKEVIVCEKPYGVSSQEGGKDNMVVRLREITGGEIYPVHRLDTKTTGLIAYAKTKESAKELSKQIQDKVFIKRYLLVCHGKMDDQGEMVDFLYHDRIKNKSFVVKNKRNGSKEARLNYRRILSKQWEECSKFSLVEVILHTGRTHQIRAQFSSRGNPLYGDGKYGAKDNDKIALHSSYLSFINPENGEKMEFTSFPEGEIWTKMEE